MNCEHKREGDSASPFLGIAETFDSQEDYISFRQYTDDSYES